MNEEAIIITYLIFVLLIVWVLARNWEMESTKTTAEVASLLKKYIELEKRRAAKEQALWKVPASTLDERAGKRDPEKANG